LPLPVCTDSNHIKPIPQIPTHRKNGTFDAGVIFLTWRIPCILRAAYLNHSFYQQVNILPNVVSKFTQYAEYSSSPYFLLSARINVKLIGNGEDEAL